MEKVTINRPIDLFVAFEVAKNKLQQLEKDHYFRLILALRIIHLCTEITKNDYDMQLREIFSSDEKMEISVQTFRLLTGYAAGIKEKVLMAAILIANTEQDDNKENRANNRKNLRGAFAKDDEVLKIIGDIQGIARSSITNFKHLRIAVSGKAHRGHPLRKNLNNTYKRAINSVYDIS